MINSKNIFGDIQLAPCTRCGNPDARVRHDYPEDSYWIFCEECHLCVESDSFVKTVDLWEKGVETND